MATDLLDNDQVSGIASLPPDLAILRMENDSIQALAAARPRDFSKIKADLEEQLQAFPQLAEDAIYRKPIGRGDDICEDCGANCFPDKKTKKPAAKCYACQSPNVKPGEMKFANGLSVRTAETLAESYGYNRVRTDVTVVDDDTVKVEATFTDYQRGRIWQDGGILTKKYKGRNGETQRTPDDRFYNIVVKAAASKHVREVILRSINPGLKAWYWEKCETIAQGLLDDKTVAKIAEKFSAIGVSPEHLESFVGKTRAAGWTQEDRMNLLGTWNAIKEGESSVYEAFGIGAPPQDDGGKGATKGSPIATKKETPKPEPAPQTATVKRVAVETKEGESLSDYWIRAMRAQPTLETLNAVWAEAEVDPALDVADTSAVKSQWEKLAKSFAK